MENDLAFMKDNASYELDIKVAFSKGPSSGLPDHGKSLWKDFLQRFSAPYPLFEYGGFGPELIIGQRTGLGLQFIDPIDERLDPS